MLCCVYLSLYITDYSVDIYVVVRYFDYGILTFKQEAKFCAMNDQSLTPRSNVTSL